MFDFEVGVFQNATLYRLFLTLVCVAKNTFLFYFHLYIKKGKFWALGKMKGTDCKQRPLLATGRGLSGLARCCLLGVGPAQALPCHDFTSVSHLNVRPSAQGLVLIVISPVAGSQPAGRSKGGMRSFAHFLKNRGTRVHFLKTGAPWIRLSMELNWSGFCAFFKGSSQVSFSG